MSEQYIGNVVEDENGELLLEFPVEMLNQMGWDEGTLLEWMIDEEENVILKEADDASSRKSAE